MESMHVQNKLRRSPILYRKYAAAGCRQQRSALGYDLLASECATLPDRCDLGSGSRLLQAVLKC